MFPNCGYGRSVWAATLRRALASHNSPQGAAFNADGTTTSTAVAGACFRILRVDGTPIVADVAGVDAAAAGKVVAQLEHIAEWELLRVLGDHPSNLRDAVRSAYLDGESDGPRSYAATAWVVKGKVV